MRGMDEKMYEREEERKTEKKETTETNYEKDTKEKTGNNEKEIECMGEMM